MNAQLPMKAQPILLYTGPGLAADAEPWGRAVSYSALAHLSIIFMLFTLSFHTKPIIKAVLTDVQFLEHPEAAVESRVGGSEAGAVQGSLQLGAPGQAENIESNSRLKNLVPYSSPFGSPNGTVVTAEPMSGPIIQSGEVGLVGRKKGSLLPLTGRTEGSKADSAPKIPTGMSGSKDNPIALSVQNIAEIQKKGAGLGAPIVNKDAIGYGGGDKLRTLAGGADLGQARKLQYEKLKSNPMGEDKWGKAKGPFSMEGPLKYRKILKMNLPVYPRWLEDQGMEAAVSIRLWVDAKGKVKETMYLEHASGFSELDQITKEALKQFVFVPIPDGAAQEDEWGVATFKFELKK